MKKIALLLLIITLSACGDGFDGEKCYMSVQKSYPNSTIFRIPEHSYRFIVVTADSSIHYIETYGSGTEITVDILIKKL